MAAQPHERSLDEEVPRTRHWSGSFRLVLHRLWPALRILIGIGIVVAAVWALASHRDELSGLSQVFQHFKWWWIPPAIVAEMASFVCLDRKSTRLNSSHLG